MMILLIVCLEEDGNRSKLVVSHGIDSYTDKIVILPNVHPTVLGAQFCEEYNEWLLYD